LLAYLWTTLWAYSGRSTAFRMLHLHYTVHLSHNGKVSGY